MRSNVVCLFPGAAGQILWHAQSLTTSQFDINIVRLAGEVPVFFFPQVAFPRR